MAARKRRDREWSMFAEQSLLDRFTRNELTFVPDAEFLAPLYGSGVKRDGQPDVTTAKAGVTAQKLRHSGLLFASTWVVRVIRESGVPVQSL